MRIQSAKQLFGLFFKAIGLLLFVVGLVQVIGTVVFLARAEIGSGTVSDYERVQNQIAFLEGTGYLYYPVVEFEPQGRDMASFASPSGSSAKPYEVGSSVPVLYDPSDPSNARIDAFWNVWGKAIVFAGLGALFLIVGFVTPYGFRSSRRAYP